MEIIVTLEEALEEVEVGKAIVSDIINHNLTDLERLSATWAAKAWISPDWHLPEQKKALKRYQEKIRNQV